MGDLEFAEAWASGETLPDENLDDRWLSVCRSLIAAHQRIRELGAKLDNLRAAERLLVRTLELPK